MCADNQERRNHWSHLCTSDTQCVPGKQCTKSSCGLKPVGANCNLATDCQSGFCAQGVCCNHACTDACIACNLAGRVGSCSNVADKAPDPQGRCVATNSETCGTTGNCVAGACAHVDKGVNCKAAVCASTPSALASFCPAPSTRVGGCWDRGRSGLYGLDGHPRAWSRASCRVRLGHKAHPARTSTGTALATPIYRANRSANRDVRPSHVGDWGRGGDHGPHRHSFLAFCASCRQGA